MRFLLLYGMCYTRNVDPDQEQPWTYNYKTRNYIYYQPSKPEGIDGKANPYDFAAVVSHGTKHAELVQIMLTSDKCARAGYDLFGYGFDATPSKGGSPTVCGTWYETDSSSTLKTANQYSADVQTWLVWKLGNLAAGESFDVKYWYLLSFPTYEASPPPPFFRLRLRLRLPPFNPPRPLRRNL